jgi:ribonuclease HII
MLPLQFVSPQPIARMPYLIGSDEAGYGPRLGPLLISVSVWQVDGVPQQIDLYERLAAAVRPAATADGPERITIADSKLLYKSRGTLRNLERAVFPALAAVGERPESWIAFWESLAGDSGAPRQDLPWYRQYDESLPIDAEPAELEQLGKKFSATLQQCGIRLVKLHSVAIFPAEFNRLTDRLGSKGAALTTATLRLIAAALNLVPADEALIVCDKHGGRNHYLSALQQQFPDFLAEVVCESRPLSSYRMGPPGCQNEFRFQAGGESFLPTALASLVSKYLRELAMRAFNAYWRERDPNLKPTAGYPQDAVRFRSDIEPVRSGLGISDVDFWRVK